MVASSKFIDLSMSVISISRVSSCYTLQLLYRPMFGTGL